MPLIRAVCFAVTVLPAVSQGQSITSFAPTLGQVDADGGWSWVTAGGVAGGTLGGALFRPQTQGFDQGTRLAHRNFPGVKPSKFGYSLGNTSSNAGSLFAGNSGSFNVMASVAVLLVEDFVRLAVD